MNIKIMILCICIVMSLLLNLKCGGGFDIMSVLFACICSPIYIIYKFITDPHLCGLR